MLGQSNARVKMVCSDHCEKFFSSSFLITYFVFQKPLPAMPSNSFVPLNVIEHNMASTLLGETSTAISTQFPSPAGSSVTPLASHRKLSDPDEALSVFVDHCSRSNRQEILQDPSVTSKRRSLSVGDADIKKPSLVQRSVRENSEWTDTTLHGIINDFKGQLSSLDPTNSTPLDLQDPSTPTRGLAYRVTTNSDDLSLSNSDPSETNTFTHVSVSSSDKNHKPKPSTTSDTNEIDAKPEEPPPVVPPRSSSLQLPALSPVRPSNFRMNVTREVSGPSKARHGGPTATVRGLGRPHILHRPTASSSEPSLIPTHTCMLVTAFPVKRMT